MDGTNSKEKEDDDVASRPLGPESDAAKTGNNDVAPPLSGQDNAASKSAHSITDKENNALKPPNTTTGSTKSNDGSKTTGGAKVKMPSSQLTIASRAEGKVKELEHAGSVKQVALDTVAKFKKELDKLVAECETVKVGTKEQRLAKEEWIAKNVKPKQNYLQRVMQALDLHDPPEVLVNDERLSIGSRMSDASRINAEYEALRNEQERMTVRRKQQAAERQLRLKRLELEAEEERLRELREQDDLEAKLEQVRLRKDAWERSSRASSVRTGHRPHLSPTRRNLAPADHTRVSNWVSSQQSLDRDPVRVAPLTTNDIGRCAPAPQELLQTVLLPKITLPVFRGNPTEYMWFMKAFQLHVEDVTQDPARRLHLLLQHLAGDAYDLVAGCQLALDPAVGLQRAKAKLREEYGSSVKQTIAFKQRLLNWPSIQKEPGDLKAFLTQLRLCAEIKANVNMTELDSSTILVQLLRKLPAKLQIGWQKRVCKIEAQRDCEADFEDFVQYVKEQSDALNHPIFGQQAATSEQRQEKTTKMKALTTTTKGETQTGYQSASQTGDTSSNQKDAFSSPCLLCQGKHPATNCQKDISVISLEDRKEKLRGLCFGCLQPGHPVKYCRNRMTCERCNRKHPTILHDPTRKPKPKSSGASDTPSTETAKKELEGGQKPCTEKSCLVAQSQQVSVGVVPARVWLQTKRRSIVCRVILDNGSTSNFVSTGLLQELGINSSENVSSTELELATMTATQTLHTQIIQGLHIADLDGNHTFALGTTYVVPSMPITNDDLPTRSQVEMWDHLQGVPLEWGHEDAPIYLLIGQTEPQILAPQASVEGPKAGQPYAVKTRLGWTINGPMGAPRAGRQLANFAYSKQERNIEDNLHRLYFTEFKDAHNFATKGPSQDDRKWAQIVDSSVKHLPSGQYQIALPFKTESTEPGSFTSLPSTLHNNRQQAYRQLQSLQRKFQRNSQFHADYVAFIRKMEDGGYVEEVEESQTEADITRPAFYIPHHGVYHPRKPGKIRVVFNCSSKHQGISLNDCLLQGPDLANSLVGVLLRFRQERVAFMADIESMFYRVLVPESQRDALRYLWWPGGEVNGPVKTYRLKVHLFGAASSPSCANYALQKTAQDALAAGVPLVTEEVKYSILNNFYVDDCLKSVADEEAATQLAMGLVAACKFGGFKLGKFLSTSVKLLQTLDKDLLAPAISDIVIQDDKEDPLGALMERALGVAWKIAEDVFFFKIAENNQVTSLTRRHMLSVLSALYDPLGFAAPVTIKARILFREATKEGIDWDTKIDESHHKEWISWKEALPQLAEVRIPRCLRPNGSKSSKWQLHVFCDASLDAYAAAAYLRQPIPESAAHVIFVLGKARVSPPKVVTVPRLELVAAKLATDIATTVQRELSSSYVITKRWFWSDSQTVLKYLNNTTKRFHTFVANRVCSILEATKACEWHFVPTESNPADEATRGLNPTQLSQSSWLTGPQFLKKREQFWPQGTSPDADRDDDSDPEVKCSISPQKTCLATSNRPASTPFVEKWAEQFSSAYRFKKAAAFWMKFGTHLMERNQVVTKPTARDLYNAERALLSWLQRETWPQEIQRLKEGKPPSHQSPLHRLSPTLNNGLLCMRSRLKVKLPLVPKGRFSYLLVKEMHEANMHMGRNITAAAILRTQWHIKLNSTVRAVLKDCRQCRRRRAQPTQPEMAALPALRHDPLEHAFEVTGVDYFGPMLVKDTHGDSKVYGVLFTCAVTRAVHLEMTPDLSSCGFINALRRFASRRGHCKTFISDQGTNLAGANAEWNKQLAKELRRQQHQQVQQQLRAKGIEWVFNAPHAPHHGGFWERLIGIIKGCLKATVVQHLTHDSLHTLLCEVESILNNRPLTAISKDADDLEPLTPNHLLIGREGPSKPPGQFRGPRSSNDPRLQWKRVQHATNQFWKRWTKEYQVLLHQRAKWHKDATNQLKVDDIVLLVQDLKPRECWKLGRVTMICPNRNADDSNVRVVMVKTANGLLKRPVSKLCLLESSPTT